MSRGSLDSRSLRGGRVGGGVGVLWEDLQRVHGALKFEVQQALEPQKQQHEWNRSWDLIVFILLIWE